MSSEASQKPRFDTLSAYQNEIGAKDKQLDKLHHEQFLHMTAGRQNEMNRMNGYINRANDKKKSLVNEMNKAAALARAWK